MACTKHVTKTTVIVSFLSRTEVGNETTHYHAYIHTIDKYDNNMTDVMTGWPHPGNACNLRRMVAWPLKVYIIISNFIIAFQCIITKTLLAIRNVVVWQILIQTIRT